MQAKYIDPYAKRYRQKLITNAVLIVSLLLITALVIIAYLGSLIGNYTIQLKADRRVLTMADNIYFNNSTVRLVAESLEDCGPLSEADLPDDATIDADVFKSSDASHNGGDEYDGKYLAYTFYVMNVSDLEQNYIVSLSIGGINVPTNTGYLIDEILRVRLYQNEVILNQDDTIITKNDSTTYAKRTRHEVKFGGDIPDDTRECVGAHGRTPNDDTDYSVCLRKDNSGRYVPDESYRATQFLTDTKILETDNIIKEHGVVRFTVVAWLEGNDPECTGLVPESAAIKLAMTIKTGRTLDI